MDVSSCPPHPALPRNPSIKQLRSSLTTAASPGRFHSFSFIHSSIFPLLRCFKPTNYHQLPPDGLCPCSCFSWPFKQPCINKPVVTNKKGGERWLFKALLRERERKPTFHTQREKKHRLPFMGLSKGLVWRLTGAIIMVQEMKKGKD